MNINVKILFISLSVNHIEKTRLKSKICLTAARKAFKKLYMELFEKVTKPHINCF